MAAVYCSRDETKNAEILWRTGLLAEAAVGPLGRPPLGSAAPHLCGSRADLLPGCIEVVYLLRTPLPPSRRTHFVAVWRPRGVRGWGELIPASFYWLPAPLPCDGGRRSQAGGCHRRAGPGPFYTLGRNNPRNVRFRVPAAFLLCRCGWEGWGAPPPPPPPPFPPPPPPRCWPGCWLLRVEHGAGARVVGRVKARTL